ncbi:MAG: alpha/beta hydrolase [Burkholderiaceae bacterium]
MQSAFEFDIEDVEYLRHGDQQLLARLFIPRGPGPFPAMVEVHGGAWCQFDRLRGKSVHEALARSGVAVIAIDFRQAEAGRYPGSVADVNFAVRWVKTHAARLKTRPHMVGISGNSSGAHLAMLAAMKPADPRYAAIPLDDAPPANSAAPEVDASVRCVVMLWPVINPSGRYRYAQHQKAQPQAPDWCERVIGFHHRYWGTEADMVEGNPMLILERGEKVQTPPALWIQANGDLVHNYVDPESPSQLPESERFVSNYRHAGGDISLVKFDAPPLFTTVHPTLPASIEALNTLVAFVHRHIPGE